MSVCLSIFYPVVHVYKGLCKRLRERLKEKGCGVVPSRHRKSRARIAHTRVRPAPNRYSTPPIALSNRYVATSGSRRAISSLAPSTAVAPVLPPPLPMSLRAVDNAAAREEPSSHDRGYRQQQGERQIRATNGPECQRTGPREQQSLETVGLPALASPHELEQHFRVVNRGECLRALFVCVWCAYPVSFAVAEAADSPPLSPYRESVPSHSNEGERADFGSSE